jgi:hypothetical protein
MGLLEYPAMPSLRNAAQDGVLCTFNNQLQTGNFYICRPEPLHGSPRAYVLLHMDFHRLGSRPEINMSLPGIEPRSPASQASTLAKSY